MAITIRSAQTIRNGVTLKGSLADFILYLDAANPASYQPGNETWFDLGPNHYDAPLYGSNFNAGWDGKSVDFANNNYGLIASANMFNGDFTAIGWVYVRSYASWSRLFDFGNGAGQDNVLIAITNGSSGYPVLDVKGGNNGGNLQSSAQIPLNQWVQLAATQSGTTQTLYINGQQVAQQSGGPENNVARTLNYIGRSNWGADAYLDGKISQLKIYSRARTQAELVTDYNRMLERFL